MAQTIQLATQESVDAQIREMARQIKDYVDNNRTEMAILYNKANISFAQIWGDATNQPVEVIDNDTVTLDKKVHLALLGQMNNVRVLRMNQLRYVENTETNTTVFSFGSASDSLKEAYFPRLETIKINTGGAQRVSPFGLFCHNRSLQLLYAPLLREITVQSGQFSICSENPLIEEIDLPSLNSIKAQNASSQSIFTGNTMLTRVNLPMMHSSLETQGYALIFTSCPNLIDIVLGHTDSDGGSIKDNLPIFFKKWSPASVLADSTKIATMNANIRNHIAANFYDYSSAGGTHTVVFSAAVYAVMEAATLSAFTDKGWTVESA